MTTDDASLDEWSVDNWDCDVVNCVPHCKRGWIALGEDTDSEEFIIMLSSQERERRPLMENHEEDLKVQSCSNESLVGDTESDGIMTCYGAKRDVCVCFGDENSGSDLTFGDQAHHDSDDKEVVVLQPFSMPMHPLDIRFRNAIAVGDLSEVRLALEQKVELGTTYDSGLTPLHLAALHGCVDIVDVLLAAGADVRALAGEKVGFVLTPAGIAELYDHADVVEAISMVTCDTLREVRLNVYDVRNVKTLNTLFKTIVGGAFHAAIEVYGQEWSFGYRSVGGSGIFGCRPRDCSAHIYRETIDLGATSLSELEVRRLIYNMAPEWASDAYDLIRRNCCHFSVELSKKLAVRPPPAWVNSLAVHVEQGLRTAAIVT
eukprot:CAMPEP_0194496626 /NCGR_PEP_ID=MMETSP0253-20130528/13833_1 /TAXON_ID=2966 /ORGANISM="Noctiluca scintillans" /LENGTH=373 /DNA_ID=CAMNT_0039338045 /DNA_START=189 /DNA_END=1310 /DNA_ORIENTATION=+